MGSGCLASNLRPKKITGTSEEKVRWKLFEDFPYCSKEWYLNIFCALILCSYMLDTNIHKYIKRY